MAIWLETANVSEEAVAQLCASRISRLAYFLRQNRGTDMSNLNDRRKYRAQIDPAQASSWKDFSGVLIFAAIGLSVTAYAIIERIPIGEYVMWGN
jgi:hypothetical protein